MSSPRLLFLITGLNLALVLAAWSRPAPGPDQPAAVLRAHLFELVDSTGQVRAQLHLGVDGSGQLRLRSGGGEVAVKLGALREGGSALLLMDPSVEPGISLLARQGGPAITVRQGTETRSLVP